MQGYAAPVPSLLVTGANGVLGRAILRALSRVPEVRLHAVVRSERAAERVRSLDVEAELTLLPDYRASSWGDRLRGIDAVAHTVGILKEGAQSRYHDAHEGSVEGLCAAARASGCGRVVYLSILGAREGSDNPCLASKARAERILLEALPSSLVLRLPMVLGGGDPASAALRTRAEAKRAWLLDGGRARDQPIDVRDAAAAVSTALQGEEPRGILELAGPEALPHRDLLLRVAQRLDRRPHLGNLPSSLARSGAWLAERLLRNPPLSVAMLDVLLQDDAIDTRAAWSTLGLSPRPLDESLDDWFQKGSE